MISLDKLREANHMLLAVDLWPIGTDRFQPTGFPNIGAAEYRSSNGKNTVLVESAQSMANRLEKTILKGDGPFLCNELEGLPYVISRISPKKENSNGKGAEDTQEIYTSSLVEPHRLNSPFILGGYVGDKKFQDILEEEMGYMKGSPLNWNRIAKAIFKYDPNSLLHGVFFSNMGDGRVKIQRAITAFIEAEDINTVEYGGVKINPIDPKGNIKVIDEKENKNIYGNVYGNVIYNRIEYTAARITATFSLDLSLIRGYELDPDAEGLLISLSLYKIRRFLNGGLRLRTACNFEMKGEIRSSIKGFELEEEEKLLETVKSYIDHCKKKGLVTDKVTEVKATSKVVEAESDNKKENAEDNDQGAG